jgi:nuclear transport factor 2 (NTF2) superfamily protein
MNPLVEFAMAHVRRCAPNSIAPDVLHHVTSSFCLVIAGAPPANLAGLLQAIIGTTAPLDRISAILQIPKGQVPTAPHRETDAASHRQQPRPWSESEDNRLLAAIHRFGLESWWSVAQFVGGGRTRAQCAQRWTRGLDPRLSRNEWSFDDEERLLRFVSEYGSKRWTRIAAAMGDRSDVQCRYHFFQMKKEGLIDSEQTQSGESWKRVVSSIQARMIVRQNNRLAHAQKKPNAIALEAAEAGSEIPWVNEPSPPDDSDLFPWRVRRSQESSLNVMDTDSTPLFW